MKRLKTIYPKKQQAILRGEDPSVSVSMYISSEKRKEGDKWTDSDGKSWEFKNGIIQSIPKLTDARTPLFCPSCEKIMKKKKWDTHAYNVHGKCFECVIKDDNERMKNGTFHEYRKKQALENELSMLIDAEQGAEETLQNLKTEIEFLNENGTTEKWTNENYYNTKEFLEKELIKIKERKDEIENLLEEFVCES